MRTQDMLKALHLPEHSPTPAQLEELKSWCVEHVAQNLEFEGDTETQYRQYANLAAKYRTFRDIAGQDILEPKSNLDNLNAIQFAAQHGFDVYLKQLTLSPEDINLATSVGKNTALHLAANSGHLNVVEVCLAKGARIDLEDDQGQYPAMRALVPSIASRDKSVRGQIFEKLSDAPNLLSHQNNSGETVFHLAAQFGFASLLERFIQERPEGVLEQNKHHQYPIQLALLQGEDEKATLMPLLQRPEVMRSLTDIDKELPLHQAARYLEDKELAKDFVIASLTAGVRLDTQNQRGETALMLASEARNKSMIEALIENGVRLSEKDIVYAFDSTHHDIQFCRWMLTQAPAINPQILDKLQKNEGLNFRS